MKCELVGDASDFSDCGPSDFWGRGNNMVSPPDMCISVGYYSHNWVQKETV